MERLQQPNPFLEGFTNLYLFPDDPVTLVDAGVATDGSIGRLERGLADHGVAVEDLDTVVLTHWHSDHCGLAGAIQERSGATVRIHADDAAVAEQDDDAWGEMYDQWVYWCEEWGMPPEKVDETTQHVDLRDGYWSTPAATVEPFEGGERIPAGDTALSVVHTPGHTIGSVCFVNGDDVLTGDTLLPGYTPNIGGAEYRFTNLLEMFLDSLAYFVDRDFDRALPGHGSVITDPADRAAATIRHHAERLRHVLGFLEDNGLATPWTVTNRLFSPLEGFHIMSGCGEVAIHLAYLERHGVLEETDGSYRPVPDAAERLDAHIEGTLPV